VADGDDGELPLYAGTATTQRTPDDTHFVFALVTDTHIAPRSVAPGELDAIDDQERTLLGIAPKMRTQNPDFIVNLGDMLDFHLFGFNDPPPDGSWTRLAYLNYRRLLQDSLGNAAHFPVIGNWDGENGDYSEEEIAWSREQRLLYVPGPTPTTYPEGGSDHQDYYAFTWGDALFVVLNVMTYTPTSHLLSTYPGETDDWTLGDAQLAWFMDTLANATSKWRFVLIHHVVGGAAGDEVNAAYGRGGGQAAQVGEQALVHQLMVDHGVQIFFYGHDHVFTDMVVDDIHYTLPGSAGAPWKFTTAETGYTEYWPDSGYARVEVSANNVQVHFIGEQDELLHGYAISD
jgi:3',5'-cyclic AMP phosphodiesterase CpdA